MPKQVLQSNPWEKTVLRKKIFKKWLKLDHLQFTVNVCVSGAVGKWCPHTSITNSNTGNSSEVNRAALSPGSVTNPFNS